jgi:hypothetical protein
MMTGKRLVQRAGIAASAALLLAGASRAEPSGAEARSALVPFQSTEQALMDAVASGDKGVWDRVMDPSCIVTTEEGQVLGKQQFLDELRPLPAGLKGRIVVRDLTVQDLPGAAIVRYLADEWESVFGQRLTTRYRVTDTYRPAGKEWRLVASHVSVVTLDPPAQTS